MQQIGTTGNHCNKTLHHVSSMHLHTSPGLLRALFHPHIMQLNSALVKSKKPSAFCADFNAVVPGKCRGTLPSLTTISPFCCLVYPNSWRKKAHYLSRVFPRHHKHNISLNLSFTIILIQKHTTDPILWLLII